MLVPKNCLNDINDSVFAREMIRQMLHKDPSQRPTLHEIQNAPFFGLINKNKTMSSSYFVDQKLMPSRKRFVLAFSQHFMVTNFYQLRTSPSIFIFSIYGSWFQVLVTLMKCQILFPEFVMRILVKKQSKFFPMNIVKIHLIKNHWFKVNYYLKKP